VSVIEEPRRLSSRLLRREPPTPSVIEEPPKFGLRTLWDKLVGEPGHPKRSHRQVTIAYVVVVAVLSFLRFSGVIAGFSADTLLLVLGVVVPAAEERLQKRSWRWTRKRPVDRP